MFNSCGFRSSDLIIAEVKSQDMKKNGNFEKIFVKKKLTHRHNLGFVPASEWAPQAVSLSQLRKDYFTRKNGAARQFDIKLYNVLCITKKKPEAVVFIGASWIDNETFKINAKVFGAFLGIKNETRTLFHKQGSFVRHGFEQVFKSSNPKLAKNPECSDVDEDVVRLFTDPLKRFSREKSYSLADISYRNADNEI